jgi:hypothetical protein
MHYLAAQNVLAGNERAQRPHCGFDLGKFGHGSHFRMTFAAIPHAKARRAAPRLLQSKRYGVCECSRQSRCAALAPVASAGGGE